MLFGLIEEWNRACANQAVTEQMIPEPGKVLYQKSIIKFRGVDLELTLSAVDDSVGIDVGRPDSYTRKLIALNTNRIVEIDPQLKNMSATDVYAAILNAIDPDARKHADKVYHRNRNHKQAMVTDYLEGWRSTLNAVGYPEEDINHIIDYCSTEMKKVKYLRGKCETFINVMAKYKNEILSTEPCNDFENKTERDVFYDEIALYIAKKYEVKSDTGSTFDNLPRNYVLDHLLKEDYDNRLPPCVMKVKNILRDVYQMCGEKNPNLCFVLVSIGAYFEKITRESPAFRYAAILERKENDRKKFTNKTRKTFQERYSDSTNQNTKERPNKPFKNKPRTEKTNKDSSFAAMNLNPIGNNMFEHALENAKPLKNK